MAAMSALGRWTRRERASCVHRQGEYAERAAVESPFVNAVGRNAINGAQKLSK